MTLASSELTASSTAPRTARPSAGPTTPIWIVVGLIGWGSIAALAATMLANRPPTAGFDLELLIEAGRRVAQGQSPYDPAILAGASPSAESLFYSYPPPVAQVMRLFGGLAPQVALGVWALGATAAMVAAGVAVARRTGARGNAREIALPLLAVLPFVFPFAVALLFGNLDAWFPALYGLMLLSAIQQRERRPALAAGAALAVAALAKLYPASLGLWFLLRGWTGRRVVGIALAVGAAFVAASLLAGGVDPWRDYAAVIRAGAGAELLDARNVGPAVQLGLMAGLDEAGVRTLQLAVSLAALAITALVALRWRDQLESLTWAAIASLVVLPVTWFHYPAALIPFGVAAVARAEVGDPSRRTPVRLLAAASVAVSVIAVGAAALVWIAVALLVAAVHVSAPVTPD
ncbi:MAG TPA: glycosyltransferase family 87 protein [Solirubrobacteraceae bacterium]|jgi:hypothetical protein